MLLEGVKFNSNLNLSVMGSFFNSILVACILFFFQFYCAFTSTAIIQSGLIYATYAAYSALAIIFIIYESVYPELLRCELPALYIESYYFNKMKLSKFMVLFLGAMISAVVIFYPAMYYMTTEITPSGIPMNSNNFTLHLIMCSHFATVLRFMFITRRGMFMIVAVAIDIAAFALVWVGIIFVNVNNSIYEVAILELLENMNSLIGFFASIMVSFIIDWALWETYHLSRLFPIFIYMKINSRKKISIDSSRALNKQLLTSFHSHPELSRTVRNCFGINDEIDLVIESILGKSSNREVEISSKTLSIESSKLRKKYGIYIVKKFLTNLRVQFGIGFLCILIFSIITAVIQRKIDQIFFVNFGITVCVFSIFMITISRAFEVNLEQFAWLITPSFAVIGAFNSLVREADHSLLSVVIVIFTITNYSIDFRMVSLMILLQFIWYCFSYLLIYDKLGSYMWTFDMDNKQAQVYAIASLVCTVFLIKITAIVQRYRIEKLIKREFIAGSVLQSKSNLTTDLLKLLLPTFVLDQMKSFDIQDKTIGDDAGEVTILFCDIADFDKVIKLKEKDIVKILDNIFRRFDELCKENGCQKIETVGKTYMACGGLKYVEQTISKELRDINPTARILDLAKQMMFEIKNYEDLTLKIGIHRGKCMMGVIGYHKPQFSLIGDVVNTTSRHCTTGEKGHIMVSHDAWGQLTQTNVKSKGYTFLEVETEMKGKGLVPVYHLMPFQGLVRKKLEEIIERYKREKKPMPEALKKIEQVLSNSRHELRRKMINSKINLLLRNVIENAKKEMKQDLLEESQMAEVNQIPARGQNRKKTIGAGAARTSKRMSTKLNIQNNARQVEPFENVESSDSEEDEDAGEYAMLKPTPMLQFKSNQFFLMKKYRQKLKEINTSTLRIFFGLMAIHYIVQIVLHITKKSGLIFTDDHPLVFPLKIDSNDEQKKFAFSFAMVLISAALSISMMLVPSFFYSRMGKLFYFSFYIFMSISSMLRLYILHGYTRLYHSHIIILELVLQYNCSIQCAVLDFVESATLFFVQLTFFLVFSILKYLSVTTSGSYLFDYIVFYLVIGIYAIFNNYHYIKTEISWYNTEGQTSKKKEMIQDFILRLIPKHLSSKIGSPELSIGDTYENVTLLFADIVGFTSYSAGKTPNEVVHMLSRLFTSFDKECNKLELYKVYTIGDCYVVMSFLDGNQRIKPEEECADVVELGFSMIEIIARVRKEVNFDGLHMRIGIHTGNIIGGIVGTDIVRFDLYGADVLIANKMESNGQQDRIHISQSSKDLLEKVNFNGRYIFTPSTPTEVKALGAQIPSYFVDKDIKNELDLSPQSK